MKQVAALLALVFASVALVACGGGDNSSSSSETTSGGETTSNSNSGNAAGGAGQKEASGGGSASTLSFEADPEGALAYTTTEATAKAGTVTIDFNNPQSLPHDVAIEDSSGKEVANTELVSEGEDSTTATLKPGTYHYFCTVPGHREAGMEGTLTVK
jgi:plastocyanin